MANMQAEGSCECQYVRFEFEGLPLFRAFCHCKICQEFNQADFADIIVVQSKDVTVPEMDRIKFKHYRQPPILSRGRCVKCNGVAIETMRIPVLPRLTILPSQTLSCATGVPDPLFHMFYHRRVKEFSDDLPKSSNYLQSQLRFSSALLAGLLRKKTSS